MTDKYVHIVVSLSCAYTIVFVVFIQEYSLMAHVIRLMDQSITDTHTTIHNNEL